MQRAKGGCGYPGFWRKRVQRSEISSATPVRKEWYWGWGIHLTPKGWLYHVSGLEAVETTLWIGKTIRIGSEKRTRLIHALDPD